jgi:hypothetical protein
VGKLCILIGGKALAMVLRMMSEKLGVDMGLEIQLETMMLFLKDATSLSLPSSENF